MFWFDQYYWLLIIPATIICLWAQLKVSSTFNKYNKVNNSRGYTGAMIAREILDENGLQHIKIERVGGKLTDHYDPKAGVIRLSDSVYNSTSVGAIGVAAHEVGHAVQYAQQYFPMKIRAFIIPATNIGSNLAIPLFFLGMILSMDWLLTFGILLFSMVVVFQLVTLPVEFNASSRAINTLETNSILHGDELKGAKKVLSAAAMTYVAALIMAIANLLRLILLRNRNRD